MEIKSLNCPDVGYHGGLAFAQRRAARWRFGARLGDERGVASNIVGRSLGYFFYDAGVCLMRKVG